MSVNINNFESCRDYMDSPRTIEACMSCGIAVQDLYPKTERDLLGEAGYKHDKAAILTDFYEQRRHQYIEEIQAERERIIGLLSNSSRPRGPEAGGSRSSGVHVMDHVEELRRAALEREHKRAEFAKEKQRTEIESMISGEVRLAEMAEASVKEERAARAREERRIRELEQARKKAAEERRKKELKKRAEADQRVLRMRREAAKGFAAEAKRLHEEQAHQKRLMAERKLEEEQQRLAQEEADRLRVEEMEAQAMEMEKRLHTWELKEAERTAKLAEFRARLAQEAEEKAIAAQARLDAALTKDAETMANKRANYDTHVRDAEIRRKERIKQEEKELQARAAARAAKQKKMRDALIKARQDEVAWTQKLASTASKQGQTLHRVEMERTGMLHDRSVHNMLHMFSKTETVRRQRRAEEYRRMQAMLKAGEEEKKLEAKHAEKEKAALERQAHQKRLLMMKHVAETELETMRIRSNFSGLSKLMEKTMNAGGVRSKSSPAGDD